MIEQIKTSKEELRREIGIEKLSLLDNILYNLGIKPVMKGKRGEV
jgi:hypothetical protein